MSYVLEVTGADVITVETDGEVTIHNPDTERSVSLSPTASDVLALCDGTMDEREIIRLLADAFDEPLEDMAVVVAAAIELLVTEALIRRVRRTG